MYVQPGEWSNLGDTRAPEARSIGTILSEIREIASLRTKARRSDRRNLALRRNSA
ncbi:hypothetical protein [Sphingomonas psychrotolerans]|uniref:hypothetical protein n=1 Tax=Sphingomonas psychrotolerans TaxID=1327635 RepID=UPI0013054272|nr:hypothetical protein [Sphingomonas psychrotolerans]